MFFHPSDPWYYIKEKEIAIFNTADVFCMLDRVITGSIVIDAILEGSFGE